MFFQISTVLAFVEFFVAYDHLMREPVLRTDQRIFTNLSHKHTGKFLSLQPVSAAPGSLGSLVPDLQWNPWRLEAPN